MSPAGHVCTFAHIQCSVGSVAAAKRSQQRDFLLQIRCVRVWRVLSQKITALPTASLLLISLIFGANELSLLLYEHEALRGSRAASRAVLTGGLAWAPFILGMSGYGYRHLLVTSC